MSNASNVEGGCLCGAVRYRLTQTPEKIIQCHCTECQKASGTGASVNAPVATADFELVQGSPAVFSKQVHSGRTLNRYFCNQCGSPLFSRRENAPEMTLLKIGTLDGPSTATVVMNVWTSRARPWMNWDEALPAHEQNRPV